MDFDKLVHTRRLEPPSGFATIESFNDAVNEHIHNHPTLEFDIDSLSCHRGRTSNELLVEPKGPVEHLERMIRDAADEYVASLPADRTHPFVASRPQEWNMSAWATILDSQGHQGSHIHATSWLSGVYYVHVPKTVTADDPNHAGWLEVGRPPDYYRCTREHEVRLFRPESGRIVFFLSYLYHRTIPFEDEENRVSVAFDFRPGAAARRAP